MLRDTETEKNNSLFCDIFIIGSISIEGGEPHDYAYNPNSLTVASEKKEW